MLSSLTCFSLVFKLITRTMLTGAELIQDPKKTPKNNTQSFYKPLHCDLNVLNNIDVFHKIHEKVKLKMKQEVATFIDSKTFFFLYFKLGDVRSVSSDPALFMQVCIVTMMLNIVFVKAHQQSLICEVVYRFCTLIDPACHN